MHLSYFNRYMTKLMLGNKFAVKIDANEAK